MDQESAQLLKIVIWGLAAIVAFLFWVAITQTRESIVLLLSNLA